MSSKISKGEEKCCPCMVSLIVFEASNIFLVVLENIKMLLSSLQKRLHVTSISKTSQQLILSDGMDGSLGPASFNEKPRPILLKFVNVTVCDSLWFNKTKLNGIGITLSEFLTKPRHDLFMAARQKLGIAKCWTREGFFYILGQDGMHHHIVSVNQLNGIVNSPPKPHIAVPKTTGTKTKHAAAATKKYNTYSVHITF